MIAASLVLFRKINLEDLPDKSVARTNLELGTAAQKDVQTSLTDTTSGSLMQVGAFGLGGAAIPVPSNDPQNKVDVVKWMETAPTGFYHFDGAKNYLNAPDFPDEWFDVVINAHEPIGYRTIIAIGSNCEMFVGRMHANKWSGWKPVYNEISSNLILPIGVPIPYPLATPPKNFLKANGSAFDQVAFPKLLDYYPSGVLPDLRGEFIRGWDDGRNVDTGRAILTKQGDAIRNIVGHVSCVRRGKASSDRADGTFRYDSNWNTLINGTEAPDDWGSIVSFDASRVVPTAAENRPRNIAFNYIIRAK